MKSTRLVVLFAMIVVLLFASAASVYAMPDGSHGTVYGQATMEPMVSIQLSGAGTDPGDPLSYHGRRGETVWPDGFPWVTVTNDGDMDTPILLGYGSDPTDGSNTWAYGTDCDWTFFGDVGTSVPSNSSGPQELIFNLAPGNSRSLDSRFTFPNNYNGNTHTMQALIIANGVL
jgi:hypothetical protein